MATLLGYVFRKDLEGLGAALRQGSDPNQVDRDGRTSLMQAAVDDQLEFAKLLLESGANVNAQDALGNSALHYAAQDAVANTHSLG